MELPSLKIFDLDQFIDSLHNYFENKSEILLAYLYGSFANGNITKLSDIDIGILITEEANKDRWYPIKLANEIEERFKPGRTIDIRILNQADPRFKFNVIKHKKRILVRNDDIRADFEANTLLEWYDVRYLFQHYYPHLA